MMTVAEVDLIRSSIVRAAALPGGADREVDFTHPPSIRNPISGASSMRRGGPR